MFESYGRRRSGCLSPVSGGTPIRSFSGRIPFSWEHLPGIPKLKQSPARFRRNSIPGSCLLLPLPPKLRSGSTTASPATPSKLRLFDWRKTKRQNAGGGPADPFLDAFIQCSKLGSPAATNEKAVVVSRNLSHRLGFLNHLYSSCKRSGGVSESIVYVPTTRRRSSFHVLNGHHPETNCSNMFN